MRTQAVTAFVGRHRVVVLAGLVVGLILATTPVVARSFSGSPGGTAPAQASQSSKPTLRIEPAIIKIPDQRRKGPKYGIWFLGSGFEPGQEIDILFEWTGGARGGFGVKISATGMLRGQVQPNNQGATAAGMEIRPRFGRLMTGGGPLTFEVRDRESNDLLTTASLVVCDPGEDEPARWCGPATDILPIGPLPQE